MKVNRREFAYSLAALAFAPPVRLFGLPVTGGAAGPAWLTDEEKALLGEISNQIVPADEFPGARELGVVVFIDRLLREAHPDWLVIYREGLENLETACREEYGKPFAGLSSEEQVGFLKKLAGGGMPLETWGAFPSDEFFEMVRNHVMQGYYSHPQWGGNKDKAAWKMIGYDDWWV